MSNINLNKIRNGDYIEGIGRVKSLQRASVVGIVTYVSEINKEVTVKGKNDIGFVRFDDIVTYVSVGTHVFDDLAVAKRVCKHRNLNNTQRQYQVYDRKQNPRYKNAKRFKLEPKVI